MQAKKTMIMGESLFIHDRKAKGKGGGMSLEQTKDFLTIFIFSCLYLKMTQYVI